MDDDSAFVQPFSLEELTQVNTEIEDAAAPVYDGCFVNDMKKIYGDIILMKKTISRLREDVLQHRKNFESFKIFVTESISKILEVTCKIIPQTEESQSVLVGYTPALVEEPFLKIKYVTGDVERVIVPKHVIQDLLACTTERELVRRVLLYVHDNSIKDLRQFTLTGKTKLRKVGNQDIDQGSQPLYEESYKSQLPLRSYLIVQGKKLFLSQVIEQEPYYSKICKDFKTTYVYTAAVEKIFPLPEQLKIDQPLVYQNMMDRKIKEVRTHITSVLNYYSTSFDDLGSKIRNEKEDGTTSGALSVTPSTTNQPKKRRRLDLIQVSQQPQGVQAAHRFETSGSSSRDLICSQSALIEKQSNYTNVPLPCSLPTLVEVISSQGVEVVEIPN
ncbi:unnamed protein product [Orchesella dallaii]|uniref:Uncharacterized protein n=1 Tax=Orchesella dallaii TaxID=48710 RepID=A0ABP1RD37_9HEXA